MVSLLDVGELSEEVPVRGKMLTVKGVSGKGVLVILQRFPEVRKIVSQKGNEVSSQDLINLTPEAIACVIAAGCGMPGNKDAERVASELGVGEQLELLDVIFRLTFPTGFGPFVEKLMKLAETSSVGGGSGWAAGMSSLVQSSNSSRPDIPQN